MEKRGKTEPFRVLTDHFNDYMQTISYYQRSGFIFSYYYIDGQRGAVKKIALPRDLVIWE